MSKYTLFLLVFLGTLLGVMFVELYKFSPYAVEQLKIVIKESCVTLVGIGLIYAIYKGLLRDD